jgi:hypothetical protein
MGAFANREVNWNRLSSPGDRFGITCDSDGPSIGPVKLLLRNNGILEPRPIEELDCIMSQALGHKVSFLEGMRGLSAIAKAIDRGELAHAMIVTQFMHLPSLPDEEAFERAVKAESLAKAGYNEDQARDGNGRWSVGGAQARGSNFKPAQIMIEPVIPFLEQIRPIGPLPNVPGFPSDILPPITGTPDIAVPRNLENPYPNRRDCAEEWGKAEKYCRDLDRKGLLGVGDYKEHGKYYAQCVRGQVSERCGGNPVARAPRGNKPSSPYSSDPMA